MVLSGAMGGLAVGYNIASTASALLQLDTAYPGIELSTKARFASYINLGGTIGALLAGPLADRVGRKLSLLISDVLLMIGTLIMCIAFASIILCVGRFVVGLGIGI